MTTPFLPHPGYLKDSAGRLVPETKVKAIDKMRDETVRAIAVEAKALNAALVLFKKQTFEDVGAFVQLSAEQYGATLGGKKGNVTLMSFDGSLKVVRQVQETITFDERLQAAKALIDECITAWSAGSSDEIKALVNDAFKVDKAGDVNTGRVLGLRRLEISDPRWQRAMQAVADSISVVGSRSYVRVYERMGDSDEYRAITMDLASA